MKNNAKIVLSAEDRTAAAFAAVGKKVDNLGFNLGSLKGAAMGALAALSVPITAGAIVALANEASKAVLEFKDLSEATGSSIENISGLDKIARSTGGGIDTVTGTLIKFNAALKDAERTKEIGAILKALNLDIEELRRLDPADALQKTAVALEGFADNGSKARAIQELFGRSVKEAAPFLRELAGAGKINATVTTKQALEVDKFNKALAALESSAKDASRSLSIDIITAMNNVIEKFKEGEKAGGNFFSAYAGGVRGFYESIGLLDGRKEGGIQPGNVFEQSAAELARLMRGPPPRPTLSVPEDPKKPPCPKKPPREGGAGAAKDPYAEANRYLESLQKQLEATENLSEVEQALRDIQLGRLGALKPGQEQAILDTSRLIDADKELQKVTKEFADLEKAAIARKKELAEAGARVYEETRTPLEKLNIEVAELQRLLDNNVISFDTFARKNFELEDAVAGLGKEVSDLDKYAQRAAQNIQDAFGDTFAQVMEGNFKDIGSAFTSMINRMVAEAAAAQLSKYLFGDLAKGGSSGGAAGDLLSNFANSIFGGAPKYATGTDFVPKDMLAVVHKGEKITPASQNTGRSGASVPNVYISQSFTGPVDRRTQQQAAAAAGMAVQKAMARNG